MSNSNKRRTYTVHLDNVEDVTGVEHTVEVDLNNLEDMDYFKSMLCDTKSELALYRPDDINVTFEEII